MRWYCSSPSSLWDYGGLLKVRFSRLFEIDAGADFVLRGSDGVVFPDVCLLTLHQDLRTPLAR